MNEMTWISIAILGPGAVGIFVWFLRDVKGLLNLLGNHDKERRYNDSST